MRITKAQRQQHYGTRCDNYNKLQLTRLYATKKTKQTTKKKKKSNSTGGGFGTSSSVLTTTKVKSKQSKKDNQDYSVYPALEESVKNTLIQSNKQLATEPNQLSKEIYDRLEQIYGFEHFNNYDLSKTKDNTSEEKPSSSMTKGSILDLLQETDSSSTVTDTSSSSSTSSFADLLSTTREDDDDEEEDTIDEHPSDLSDCLLNLSQFDQFRILHIDPMVLAIDNFFTTEECDRYVKMSTSNDNMNDKLMSRSQTVGKDIKAKSQRTSTTWYHYYKNVPELLCKATKLLGLSNIKQWEEPQTVRYQRNEKFTWHLDALGPNEINSTNKPGGQRIATLLVYLTDMNEEDGGATIFRDLTDPITETTPLKMQPKKGSALLFFPAAGGIQPHIPFDIRTLHAGEIISSTSNTNKWIAQMWLRHLPYTKPTAPTIHNTHDDKDTIDAIRTYCNSNNQQ